MKKIEVCNTNFDEAKNTLRLSERVMYIIEKFLKQPFNQLQPKTQELYKLIIGDENTWDAVRDNVFSKMKEFPKPVQYDEIAEITDPNYRIIFNDFSGFCDGSYLGYVSLLENY